MLGLCDRPLATREFVAKWEEKFPEAIVLDLPDAGHFWQEDAPERVAAAIVDAFARTEANSPRSPMP